MNRRAYSGLVNFAGMLIAGGGMALIGMYACAPNERLGNGGLYRDRSQDGCFLFYENRAVTGADFVFTSLSSIVVMSALGIATGGGLIWLGRRIRSL